MKHKIEQGLISAVENMLKSIGKEDASFDWFLKPTESHEWGELKTDCAVQLSKESGMPIDAAISNLYQRLSQDDGASSCWMSANDEGMIFFSKPRVDILRLITDIQKQEYFFPQPNNLRSHYAIVFLLPSIRQSLSQKEKNDFTLGKILAQFLKGCGRSVRLIGLFPDHGKEMSSLIEAVGRRYFQLQGVTMDFPSHCPDQPEFKMIAKRLDLPIIRLDRLSPDKAKQLIAEHILDFYQKKIESELIALGCPPDEWTSQTRVEKEKPNFLDSHVISVMMSEKSGLSDRFHHAMARWTEKQATSVSFSPWPVNDALNAIRQGKKIPAAKERSAHSMELIGQTDVKLINLLQDAETIIQKTVDHFDISFFLHYMKKFSQTLQEGSSMNDQSVMARVGSKLFYSLCRLISL